MCVKRIEPGLDLKVYEVIELEKLCAVVLLAGYHDHQSSQHAPEVGRKVSAHCLINGRLANMLFISARLLTMNKAWRSIFPGSYTLICGNNTGEKTSFQVMQL